MNKLLGNLTEKQANLFILILESQGISADFTRKDGVFDIIINDRDRQGAERAITKFLKENVKKNNKNTPEISSLYIEKPVMIFSVFVLAAIYFGSACAGNEKKIIMEYGCSAFYILNGQYYRIITGLMLHAGVEHLAGNVAGLLAFGIPVCTIAGAGAGLFLIILTGAAGNLINACMYRTAHLSIGASTSVMGAIGLLVAFQTMKKIKLSGFNRRTIIPFGAGAALIGMLSGGQNTDISAHFFGFITGLAAGLGFSFLQKNIALLKESDKINNYYLFFTLAIILISWLKLI